jgi:methionyl aminopeptidase
MTQQGKSIKRVEERIYLHKPEDFIAMRKAGKLASQVLDYITQFVEPGVTTEKLDQLCHDMIIENGAIPACLGYKGYTKTICTSVNHVVCHGIPSDKKLQKGDIVNIDVTVKLDGWFGDTSRMYLVGNDVPLKARRLVQVTYDAMMLGIEQVKPGVSLNEVGKAIEAYAKKHHYTVVREYCGHGIGKVFHAPPNILHYYSPDENNIILEEGMFFTIEPMINAGGWETKVLQDDWTVVTKDRSLSAQFEHTIGVTKNGYEIFTLSAEGK